MWSGLAVKGHLTLIADFPINHVNLSNMHIWLTLLFSMAWYWQAVGPRTMPTIRKEQGPIFRPQGESVPNI